MNSDNQFIKFLGGKNLVFILTILILIGIMIFIYDKISFIFYPIIVILSTITPPIILAFIAYYLLNPIVNLLEKGKIKRIWGIIIIIIGISGLITGLVLMIAPAIEKQITELISTFPGYVQQLWYDVNEWIENSFLAPYYDNAYNWVVDNFSNIPSIIGTYILNAFAGVQSFASTVTNFVVALVTFPIILFFLLKDGERFKEYSLKLLPPKYRGDINHILKNMDAQVGSYIQGQIIVASCIGILLYIGYLIIGLEYAITLAILAGILSVVPYLGPTLSIIPAVIIAIVNSPLMLLKLAVVWIVVQFLEGNFISPNIMGKTMKIHPLTIIIVLLVAGNLFGLIGVVLGIPGYAILKVLVTYIYNKFKERYNRFYGETYGEYSADEK
ncbi:AI-2E family transporter [Ornithinibacillus halotolerans]|uniref:AI-2E family transporter n=1 Tax=Ornithinibacillus halotolerans TaxID=1274357 RepID=A0A916S1I7_9BACI|nr:AI-2E family transporter [Ornithinibacillus halotolerans]GGA77768.1 AI-2E family transporter [Ornithinibacillus halotolerans]